MPEHVCPRCKELTNRYDENSLCEDCQEKHDHEEDLHNSQEHEKEE